MLFRQGIPYTGKLDAIGILNSRRGYCMYSPALGAFADECLHDKLLAATLTCGLYSAIGDWCNCHRAPVGLRYKLNQISS